MRYPSPAVSAAVLSTEGKILLTRRSGKAWWPGTWCLPGGLLEGGLDWVESLRREIREGLGLEARAERLYGIYSDPRLSLLELGGEKRHFLVAAFLVREIEGHVRLNEEVDDFGWFAPGHLPSPLLPTETQKIEDAFRFNGTVFVR